jgi:hypothetical protein
MRLDLQIVSLKHLRKKDSASFDMRDAYPKILKLSVKECASNKPQMDGGSVT